MNEKSKDWSLQIQFPWEDSPREISEVRGLVVPMIQETPTDKKPDISVSFTITEKENPEAYKSLYDWIQKQNELLEKEKKRKDIADYIKVMGKAYGH